MKKLVKAKSGGVYTVVVGHCRWTYSWNTFITLKKELMQVLKYASGFKCKNDIVVAEKLSLKATESPNLSLAVNLTCRRDFYIAR